MSFPLISGFSKRSKEEQIAAVAKHLNKSENELLGMVKQFWHTDIQTQEKFDGFSENTISNFYLPYNIAPNFIINNEYFFVPMVIEESSVVAAASHAAKFWAGHGGFNCRIKDTTKLGQIHFFYSGDKQEIQDHWEEIKNRLWSYAQPVEQNMKKRGGGITDLILRNLNQELEDYYQIHVEFDTRDSMGANFINSCLEAIAEGLQDESNNILRSGKLTVLMAILSNYTPDCAVECFVETDVQAFNKLNTGFSAEEFAQRFQQAVQIAEIDKYRATTHNKGIFNGVDAVVIATGNDFRAAEACGHTHAAASGSYKSLTSIRVNNNIFRYTLELPIALGTVGGLTKLHPLAALSLEILGNPSAEKLMMIAAATGLANNFSAVRSLVTHGIQKGHMKMHLSNILSGLSATEEEKLKATSYFSDNPVSFHSVELYLKSLRSKA